jgi:thiol-disulfide isomerase/thioredoxin
MKIKSLITIFLSSLVLFVVLTPVRIYLGSPTFLLIGFVLFFLLTLLFNKKYEMFLPVWVILAAIILGQWIPELPMRTTSFEETLISLPGSLIHTLGIICGFLYWRLRRPFNILTAFLGCLITVFMFFQGYEYWYHKLNYGTFTGKVQQMLRPKFEAYDAQNGLITDRNFQDKIVLLDFWFTRCATCFEKFPQVQAIYDIYKNDPTIAIFAVDAPIEEDTPGQAFQMIKEAGYVFPVLIAKDQQLPEKFGIKYYPTTFVIDRSGQIVFRGDIAGAVKMVEELKESDQ